MCCVVRRERDRQRERERGQIDRQTDRQTDRGRERGGREGGDTDRGRELGGREERHRDREGGGREERHRDREGGGREERHRDRERGREGGETEPRKDVQRVRSPEVVTGTMWSNVTDEVCTIQGCCIRDVGLWLCLAAEGGRQVLFDDKRRFSVVELPSVRTIPAGTAP